MRVLQCRGPWLCFAAIQVALFASVSVAAADSNDLATNWRDFCDTVKQDYENLYLTPSRLFRFGVAFGAGGVMANTHIDQGIQDWYQTRVRTDSTDNVSDVAKMLGDGRLLIPVSVLSALVGDKLSGDVEGSLIGTWGQRATRAYLAGAPALLLSQWATGGSRPTEDDSDWRPFRDNNGVGGHAFVGGVAFLTAGRMCQDNALARYGLYALSALPAWSRINDNAHYASQSFLGWFLAWETTGAILQTDREARRISLAPMITPDACGLSLCIQW